MRAAWSSARPPTERAALAASGNSLGRAVARPAGVVEQRAPVFELAQHLGERVLDGLVGADRATEGVALLGVGDGHVEGGFDAAERLRGDQRLREVPGRDERLSGASSTRRGGVLQRHVAERAGRVIAAHRLDLDAGGVGLDRDADRPAVEQGHADEPFAPGASGTNASSPLSLTSACVRPCAAVGSGARASPCAGSALHSSFRSPGGCAGR